MGIWGFITLKRVMDYIAPAYCKNF